MKQGNVDYYYLHTCALIIRFCLTSSEFPQQKERFRHILQYSRKHLITRKIQNNQTVDHEVWVIDFDGDRLLLQDNEELFIAGGKIKNKKTYMYYHINETEFNLLLLKSVQKLLPKRNAVLFHASSIIHNNFGIMFIAPTGGGKSTIIQLLQKLGSKYTDDISIIKKTNNSFELYQSPFSEKNPILKRNNSYPLKLICILHKSKKCNLRTYSFTESLKKVAANALIVPSTDKRRRNIVSELVKNIPVVEFSFNLSQTGVKKLFTIAYQQLPYPDPST